MGNLFSMRIQKNPADMFTLKEHKEQVERHSATIGAPVLNVKGATIVDLESGLVNCVDEWEGKKRKCRWIDLRFGLELVQLMLFWFRKKVEQVSKREGESNGDIDEVLHSTKVEQKEFNSFEVITHVPSNIRITWEDLQCLRPGAWLNDEVINLYLELLKERERREPQKFLTCHFFNTFFFKKLISGRNGYDFEAVRRWTTQVKLGYTLIECNKVFVPIHKDIHWCLVVINVKDKTFQYLDSLGGMDTLVLEVLARYFMEEAMDKGAEGVDTTYWKRETVDGLPLQINGCDCGMFMLKYIDFYSRGLNLLFGQEHIADFRERTIMEIMRLTAE